MRVSHVEQTCRFNAVGDYFAASCAQHGFRGMYTFTINIVVFDRFSYVTETHFDFKAVCMHLSSTNMYIEITTFS